MYILFKNIWKPFLKEAKTYLSGLKGPDGKFLCMSRKKTPFVGFMIGSITLEKVRFT